MDATTTRPEQCVCPACGAAAALPADAPKAGPVCPRCGGRLFVGRFALIGLSEQAGPVATYKAFHADLGTLASLRLFRGVPRGAHEAFFRRAEVLTRLGHPSLAAVFGAGEHEGQLYAVSQYVEGTRANEASLSLRESVAAVRDAALAVDCAHAANVIHGGLRPGALWIARQKVEATTESFPRVLVDGWGPAPAGQAQPPVDALAFFSPEQAEGKPADSRSDVYSLGSTLYALATGRPPYKAAQPVDLVMSVAAGQAPPPSQANPLVDSSLDSVIQMSMDRDPSQRYPEASELAQDLTRWLTGGSVIKGPSTRHRQAIPEFVLRALAADRRKQRAIVIAASALAAVILILVVSLWPGEPKRTGSEPPVAASPAPAPAPAPAEPRPEPRVERPLPAREPEPVVTPPKPVQPPEEAVFRAPPPPAPPPPPPSPKPPPKVSPASADLGNLIFLHPRFGAFVQLGPGVKVSPGQVLAVVRGSEVVATLAVEMVTSPESIYPHGCAVCQPLGGLPRSGDRVRPTVKPPPAKK